LKGGFGYDGGYGGYGGGRWTGLIKNQKKLPPRKGHWDNGGVYGGFGGNGMGGFISLFFSE